MRRIIGMSALALFSATTLAAGENVEKQARAAIAKMLPDATIDAMKPAPQPGYFEARIGSQLLYVSDDGKYIVQGSVFDVAKKRDLTEASRADLRRDKLAQFDDTQGVVFSAAKAKHEVTIFTDFDCGYCRKLHQHIDGFNAAGITVKYLLYPRGGLDSNSHLQAQYVWCAADRQAAFTAAKAGTAPEPKMCPNPVADQFRLGLQIGVTSTPTIIASDGTYLGGYLDPQQMLARLEQLGPDSH